MNIADRSHWVVVEVTENEVMGVSLHETYESARDRFVANAKETTEASDEEIEAALDATGHLEVGDGSICITTVGP